LPARDPQAVTLLTRALNASGAANPVNPLQDFVATGTITYFWAGEEVKGTATVRARGADQFRLDANLPEGMRSWVATARGGMLVEASGERKEIPLHNTINLGSVIFPYLNIAAALNDPLTAVSYRGLADLSTPSGKPSGRRVHQVRLQRNFSKESDPDGTVAKLCVTDYFIDPTSGLILKTLDMTHPVETLTEDLEHEIEFESYQVINGVNVPTLIREKIIGQTIWELMLSSISFNAGLTDSDFTL